MMFIKNLLIVIISSLLLFFILFLLQMVLLLEFAFQGINASFTFIALILLNILVLKILPEESAESFANE